MELDDLKYFMPLLELGAAVELVALVPMDAVSDLLGGVEPPVDNVGVDEKVVEMLGSISTSPVT